MHTFFFFFFKSRTFCVHGMLLTNKPGPYSAYKFWFTRWQLTWISDGESAHPEVLSAGGTQLNVVTIVVVHACLGQHSVVLNLTLPATTIKIHWLEEQFAVSIVKLHHSRDSWKKMPKLKINTYIHIRHTELASFLYQIQKNLKFVLKISCSFSIWKKCILSSQLKAISIDFFKTTLPTVVSSYQHFH